MNPLNLFKFLEKEKGKPIPVKLKLIHGLPLTPEELDVKGNLDFRDTSITSLPQGLKVEGYLYLGNTPIISLPQGLKVGASLDLRNTPMTSLPPDLQTWNLWISGAPLAKKSEKKIRAMLTTGYIKGVIIR
jgi:hypothetical protein